MPSEMDWVPGMAPPHVQEPTSDPNRGQAVRSVTGLFRGLAGSDIYTALRRAIENLDGWIPVSSSNVAAGAYSFEQGILFIRFRNGGNVYYYPGSTPAEWMEFLQAGSKGKWVHRVLRTDGTDMRVYGIMPGA